MAPLLGDDAHLVACELRVRGLDRVSAFYRELLGMSIVGEDDAGVELAPPGDAMRLRLTNVPDAPPRAYPSIGLYHIALLVPDRPALARMLRRLRQTSTPMEGSADHGVSEALYLRDPEMNGVEIYVDRDQAEWPRDEDGIAMTTIALDARDLLSTDAGSGGLSDGTRLGHIHLHVPALDAAERFFADTLGLTVTQRGYPGARFFAAGSYHHHVGTNTWARGRRSPPEATGLVGYTWASAEAHGRDPVIDPIGAEVRFTSSDRPAR